MRDIDIRRTLRIEIERLHHDEPATRIVEELGLCQGTARVDLAVINGDLHGYEIKSERDTLARLPGQTNVYNRALDYVTIVTSLRHYDKISRSVPSWWGIWIVIQAVDSFRLELTREASRNPEVDAFAFAQLLWREEAFQALSDYGLAAGMRSKPRTELWQRLASFLTLEELGEIVRERLKLRHQDWRSPAPQA